MTRAKSKVTRPKKPAPGPQAGAPGADLPPPSPEALAIDRMAGVAPGADPAQVDPAQEPAAPDLSAAITDADTARITAETQAQAAQLSAQGTAQLLVMVVGKVAAKRWPGVEFSDDEVKQSVEVLAPIFIKYDLSSALLDKWKEEFSAGMFFFGLIHAKQEQYRKAQAEAAEKKKTDEGAAVQ